MNWCGKGDMLRPARRPAFLLFGLLIASAAPGATGAEAESGIRLRNLTPQTGITFRHTDGGSGRRYVVETVTAGLALFDYDRDGDEDIYFLNGAPLRGTTVDVPPRNALYRNDGGFRFTDVTTESGAGDTGYGLGVAAADYDNDGDLDLYLNNYGPNVLYRNNGDGTFTDVTALTNTADGDHVGAGTCFLDIDRDGNLDLYVSRYLEFRYEMNITEAWRGHQVYPGPWLFPPLPDALYRNDGDGTFRDVSRESGVAGHPGKGMGVISADYDDDGDTDIIVANDSWGNFLFQNDGRGNFEEVGLMAGIAYDLYGDRQGSMGAECEDYDNDGRFDLHVTSYQRQLATLYRNLGDGFFEDVTQITGAGAGTRTMVTWGNGLVDFDNDGDRDLFIACGHLYDNVHLFDDTTSYEARNILLRNDGGRFTDVSAASGDGMQVKLSSRGAAFDDLDNDGDVDVVVLNSRREPTVLRNDTENGNHWLQVRLEGVECNRDGVGSKVTVVAGDLTQVSEVHSGRGYQSHYGMRLHFGLGRRDRVDRVEVRWLGGDVEVLRDLPVDQVLTVRQGAASSGREE